MKNYSLSKEESREFIKHYLIKDRSIIVNLANNEKYTVSHTVYNEGYLRDIMEKQVKETKTFGYNYLTNLGLAYGSFGLLVSILLLIKFGFSLAMIIVMPISAILTLPKVREEILNKDKRKNKYFLENKASFSKGKLLDKTIQLNLGKNITNKINSSIVSESYIDRNYPININNLDNYSLRELRLIKSFIDKQRVLESENRIQSKKLIKHHYIH